MTTNSVSSANGSNAPRALVLTDRWFRAWGVVTLVGLVTTGALLTTGADAWRSIFALSHLAALLALVPLGVALIATHYAVGRREAGSAAGGVVHLISRRRVEAAFTALAFVGVAIALWQFDGGIREVRPVANLVTVASVLALVVRYLRADPPRT